MKRKTLPKVFQDYIQRETESLAAPPEVAGQESESSRQGVNQKGAAAQPPPNQKRKEDTIMTDDPNEDKEKPNEKLNERIREIQEKRGQKAESMTTQFEIDPEFQTLIPPLDEGELFRLEENLKREGCRDPLVTWNGLLLDGHHRYSICNKHNIPFKTVEQPCVDRDEAIVWIILNQLGKRNLQPFHKSILVLKLEPLIAARAKANQKLSGGRGKKGSQNSANLIDTRGELAKRAGVSHDTISKVKVLAEVAPEPVKEQLRRGETTINREYQKYKPAATGKKKSDIPKKAKSPEKPNESILVDRFFSDIERTMREAASVVSPYAFSVLLEGGWRLLDTLYNENEERIKKTAGGVGASESRQPASR